MARTSNAKEVPTLIFKALCTLSILCLITPAAAHGGLLSAYLRAKNFHYVVRNWNDLNESNETLSSQELGEEDNSVIGPVDVHEDSNGLSSTLLAVTSSSSSSSSSYTDCGSVAKIQSLSLSPCNTKKNGESSSSICEIERGSVATFALSFVPKKNATQIKAVIHGIIDYVPIPFPCPQPDACENSGISCPILAGKQYNYRLSAPIKESYPRMKLWVKGQLEDEDGTNLICVKMHVHIV